ncbi:MAG: hypothetical protein K9G41_10890 [Flavobacteriales bacterium]|nr:hypothetical protein [Flavobacteriales bacterium]
MKHLKTTLLAFALLFSGLTACLTSCNTSENESCDVVGAWETSVGTDCNSQARLQLNQDNTGTFYTFCADMCDSTGGNWAMTTQLTYSQNDNDIIVQFGARDYCGGLDTVNQEVMGTVDCEGDFINLNLFVMHRQ